MDPLWSSLNNTLNKFKRVGVSRSKFRTKTSNGSWIGTKERVLSRCKPAPFGQPCTLYILATRARLIYASMLGEERRSTSITLLNACVMSPCIPITTRFLTHQIGYNGGSGTWHCRKAPVFYEDPFWKSEIMCVNAV